MTRSNSTKNIEKKYIMTLHFAFAFDAIDYKKNIHNEKIYKNPMKIGKNYY